MPYVNSVINITSLSNAKFTKLNNIKIEIKIIWKFIILFFFQFKTRKKGNF
jgi:hypothetical protein